jgi:photosystem II stability/assembly factor-like uncharacterized protein
VRAKHVLPALIVLLLAAPLASEVHSTPGEWRRLGPDGGQVDDLAVAPGNPKVVYASAQGAIYRSLNGGATWALRSDDVFPLQLTVDAANPFLVYGTDGDVYRSLDGGATWATLDGPGYPYGIRQLVAHPKIANMVFAATTGGVFRSADAGLRWKAVRGGLPQDFDALRMVIDPVSPRRMYLLTEGNSLEQNVFFKSLDGGSSWQPMDDSFTPAGDFVTAFATDPRSSRTLYAAVDGRVQKSTDGGATWKATGTGLEGYVLALLIPPGRPGSVHAGTDQGLFLSLDGGATWVRQSLRVPPSGGIDRLVASGGELLASVYGTGRRNGVFRSRDGGISWAFSGRGISAMDVTVIASGAPGTIWILADFILFRSTDDGLTWRLIQPGRAMLRPPVALAVAPTDRSNVFVLDSGGAVWRSDDAGTTWEPAGNAGLYVYDLQVDPQTPSTLYAAGFRRAAGAGGIAKSTDRGDTWTLLSAEPAKSYYEVHIAPSSPSTLYAAASLGDFTGLLLRSTDAGATWARMNFEAEGTIGSSLAVDPLVATTVYASDFGNIYRSTDGGNTWSEIGDSANSNTAYPLVISDTGRLYAGALLTGVVSYADGDPIGDLLGGRYFYNGFYALAPDPHDPCRLFAGPWARSLLVFRHTGIDGCPAP